MPSSVRTKDFLSILDFEPGELESCLSLAARVKRETRTKLRTGKKNAWRDKR